MPQERKNGAPDDEPNRGHRQTQPRRRIAQPLSAWTQSSAFERNVLSRRFLACFGANCWPTPSDVPDIFMSLSYVLLLFPTENPEAPRTMDIKSPNCSEPLLLAYCNSFPVLEVFLAWFLVLSSTAALCTRLWDSNPHYLWTDKASD